MSTLLHHCMADEYEPSYGKGARLREGGSRSALAACFSGLMMVPSVPGAQAAPLLLLLVLANTGAGVVCFRYTCGRASDQIFWSECALPTTRARHYSHCAVPVMSGAIINQDFSRLPSPIPALKAIYVHVLTGAPQ